MNDFDEYLRSKAKEDQRRAPESAKSDIERTLAAFPEKESKKKRIFKLPNFVTATACFIFLTVFLLPNISTTYAKALEKVPIIGDIVRVVTIRNYFYSDDHHEMDIEVPKIEDMNNKAADYINMDINQLTTALVNQFYKDIELNGSGYGAIYVDYETVTNTGRWFTLKLSVNEIEASSNNYFRYYHIDKFSGKTVALGDLFSAENYADILSSEIKRQMKQQMASDETVKYWLNGNEIGAEFSSIRNSQNFYWNENGELVIAFDKYEVGPGYMGTPEFVISKDILKDIIKPEYKDIIAD